MGQDSAATGSPERCGNAQLKGKLSTGAGWRIEADQRTDGKGFLGRLNAVYVLGGKRVAHVTLCFPRAFSGAGRGKLLMLPVLLPWEEFQRLLVKVD
jgi:hypothetical protein